MNVILASASARRVALIKLIKDFNCTVMPSKATEVRRDLACDTACVNALLKSTDVARAVKGTDAESLPIIGCDTVVEAPNGEILGKPIDEDDARRMFSLLCGRTHSVYTGLAVTRGVRTWVTFVRSEVSFGTAKERVIEEYIKSGAPFDKAGGYGIQDEALADLDIKTDNFYNVMGLPVDELRELVLSACKN